MALYKKLSTRDEEEEEEEDNDKAEQDAGDIDSILDDIVGGGGRWQWTKLLLLVPQNFTNGLPLLLHMFTAYSPGHRCFVEGCDQSSTSKHPFEDDFLNFTTPSEASGDHIFSAASAFDPCSLYVRSDNDSAGNESSSLTCSADDFTSATANCSRFVYDNSEFSETLTTKFDLVCSRVGMQHLLGSVMMVGLMLGSLFGGALSDRFGRRRAMSLGMSVAVPAVAAGALVQSYAAYVALRLVTCTVIVFSWISVHNFQLEFFSKRHRKNAYCVFGLLSFFVGYAVPAIMYFNRDWRSMHWAVAAASVPGLVVTYFVIPESVRWLVCNGKVQEAEKILQDIARGNGRDLSPKQEEEIRRVLNKQAEEARFLDSTDRLTTCDLVSGPLLSRTLVLASGWVCSIVSYYALLLNVGSLSGDIFANFAISQTADVPAQIAMFVIVDRFGRRRCLSASLGGLGLSCLAMAWVPKGERAAVLAFYVLGKFNAQVSGNVLWLYTAELYPTNLRSQAVGTCSMISRIFGTTSSFLPELSSVWPPLPMLLLGVPALLSARAAMVLPETNGRPLPQTMEEALTIGLEEKVGVGLNGIQTADISSEED